MTKQTEEKIDKIVIGTIMVLLSPAILAFGLSAWFVVECLLDDDARYELGKK